MARSPQLINLKRELYQRAIGMPEDPSGLHEMTDPINYLVEAMMNFEVGDADIRDVRVAFKTYPIEGFDIDWWISKLIAEGVYSEDALEPFEHDEEEFDPTLSPIPEGAVNVVPFRKPEAEEV